MSRADLNHLLGLDPAVEAEEIKLRDGSTVTIRGLSRFEVTLAQKNQDQGTNVLEQFIVSKGLVDPKATEEQVAHWQRVSKGGKGTALDQISEEILTRSGLLADANAKKYDEFEADPGSEFRPLPGEGTGDDGHSDAPRDAE